MKPRFRLQSNRSLMLLLSWMLSTHAAAQEETNSKVIEHYTAQRRPRVTVLDFKNTNKAAEDLAYGASVEAMLVTFLKRKSQLTIVERQQIDSIKAEWTLNQQGETNVSPEEQGPGIYEKVDAIILGDVTLLGEMVTAEVEDKSASGAPAGDGNRGGPTTTGPARPGSKLIPGQRIEIDAKLLSRRDGRIIAAAQRSGPVTCLRSIVERLGIALEQQFLRPYYGQVTFRLSAPDNVRIHLTPILLDTASDDEKPPVERTASVLIGGEWDVVEPWATDPITYTINDILTGWYSLRLTRSGYHDLGADNARWQARERRGEFEVVDIGGATTTPLAAVSDDLQRFVVRVAPLSSAVIDGDALGFKLEKQHGSFQAQIRRQYLDSGFGQTDAMRVMLYGDDDIHLNKFRDLDEFAADQRCDLFREQTPNLTNYGRTLVAQDQSFNYNDFQGGSLIFEDYRGEELPVGTYEVYVWEPLYEPHTTQVVVQDGDNATPLQSALTRTVRTLKLGTTGSKPSYEAILTGASTGRKLRVPLDFDNDTTELQGPIDEYTAKTEVPGLQGWQRKVDLLPKGVTPPTFNPEEPTFPPEPPTPAGKNAAQTPSVQIKTRLVVGGRLDVLSSKPDLARNDVFVDNRIQRILDVLFGMTKATVTADEQEDPGSRAVALDRPLTMRNRLGAQPTRPRVVSAPQPIEQAQENALSAATIPGLLKQKEDLLNVLEDCLDDTDLLLLNADDMTRLRKDPEVSAVVARFVGSGGALFAFLHKSGDYSPIVGSTLILNDKGKKTNKFKLSQGDVPGFKLPLGKKDKARVQTRRLLPTLERSGLGPDWRVLAFTRGRQDQRIIERGASDQGGYVAVWLDDLRSFRETQGTKVDAVAKTRIAVETRLWAWARYLMYRRYDSEGELRESARAAIAP